MTESIGRPLYRQLADDLRSKIASGALNVGDPIPSTQKLMQDHGASNSVVRAAVGLLREEGLLIGQPGKAVYVRATPQAAAEQAATIDGLAQQVEALREKVDSMSTDQDHSLLKDEIGDVRRMVGVLHSHMIELYSRVGQAYPHDMDVPADTSRSNDRRRSL